MAGNTSHVTVIILNWNGRELTLQCLRSLSALDYPDYDIVVVDNASSDGSARAVREAFPGVTVVENESNLGFSGGNNRGIELALDRGADYVLLLNNDTTLVHPGFLSLLVAYLEDNRDAAAVGPLVLYPRSDLVWSAGGRLHLALGLCSHMGKNRPVGLLTAREPYRVDYVPGCCMLIRSGAVAEVGQLDPDYFLYFEDLDWCCRAARHGYRCMIYPVAAIYHEKSGTSGEAGTDRLSPTQAFFFARNGILFARKNLEGLAKISFLAAQFTVKIAYSFLHMENAASFSSYLRGIAAGMLPRHEWGKAAI